VNLTGARSAEERVAILVEPVLALRELATSPLLDIGSGNGSPGLVLALLEPGLQVTLLEPRRRRWAFLREAARAAGRPEVQALCQRHEAWRGGEVACVSLRALRLPAAELHGLLRPGGRLLVLGDAPEAHPGLVPEPAPRGAHSLRRV
jgi:16S rRNA (guanine527-N7)-methyltransferase